MDLSDFDLIAKYYAPCEIQIRRKLVDLCKDREDVLISFIDVSAKDQLRDSCKKIVITDQIINAALYPGKTILTLPNSIFGIYYIPVPLTSQKIQLDFNMFNNRGDINRLFCFYKLLELGWIDSGAVSYIGSSSRSPNTELSAGEFVDFLHKKYFYPNYQAQHDFVRNHVPYQNFKDLGDLRQVMMQTKLSVIIGATGSVARLRSLGFDVFDDYVDHSHDLYPSDDDVIKQTDHILAEIKRFRDLEITQVILDDWNRKYQKNMKILSSWNQIWQKDLQTFIAKIK